MADLYKLSDGTSSVDLTPTRGLNIPETRIRQQMKTKLGHSDTHEWGNKEKYDIPLIDITKARADQLLSWWLDMDVLTFTPDQASSGATIEMVIDSIERPLNMWHRLFDTKYAGMLRLCEVSSQSFSSSFVSVSGSESCSSFNSSISCSLSASLSCSVFLTFVSHSSSAGVDVVEDASCSNSGAIHDSVSQSGSLSDSCSVSRSCSEYESVSNYSSYVGGGYSYFSSRETLSSCEDFSSCSGSKSNSTFSSGSDSQSCSDSRSSSVGVIAVSFTSQSCSLDQSESSCSTSAAGTSCSQSAGGIS